MALIFIIILIACACASQDDYEKYEKKDREGKL